MTTPVPQTRLEHRDTAPPAGAPGRATLAAVGFGVACVVACSLPLVIGGGAAAALGAFLSGAGPLAGVLATIAAGGAAWWLVRRRRARADAKAAVAATSCGCGGAGC